MAAVAIGMVFALRLALAEDLLVDGKLLKNVTVKRVEPDGVTLLHSVGVCKVSFEDLPSDWQQKYGYDPEKAAEYRASSKPLPQAQDAEQHSATEAEIRRGANNSRVTVNIEVSEPRQDGMVVTGTKHIRQTVDVLKTNVLEGLKESKTDIHRMDGSRGRSVMVTKRVETITAAEPFGAALVVGLPPNFVKGSKWSGVLYPVNRRTKEGLLQYATTLDGVVALETGSEPAVNMAIARRGTGTNPFLLGIKDSLTSPVRAFGVSGLHFALKPDRDFRYWAGIMIGALAYVAVLLLLLSGKKR